MIFYRLAIQKFIKYFKLDELFKEDEYRRMLLRKKPKKVIKPKIQLNPGMDLGISGLLSLITALVCFSIPYVVLVSPCEPLKAEGFKTLYEIAKNSEKYTKMIDRSIIALSIILVVVTVVALADAISKVDLSISPWVERGKYNLPKKKEPKITQPNSVHFAHFKADIR